MKAKKWLAVLLAVLTAASLLTFAPAASAAGVSQQTAQQVVSALGIMVGDNTGNMNLNNTLTRSQLAKILVSLSGSAPLSSATSPFPDVPYKNWAAPYVTRAIELGYISGYPDGTFRPDQNTRTEELTQTLLAVLGYTSADFGVGYPSAQMSYAQKLGLLDGVTAQVGAAITRRDVMMMVYNTLDATAKSGKKYITALGYGTTASGDIDVAGILSASSVGPLTVKSTAWYSGTGLNTASATVYLNDKLSTLAAVLPNDIVYYSVNLNTIWAYDKKVTGTLQNALPSRLSPTSVVVSGNTYTLGATAASTAASYTGGFNYGDTITLLLDRSGNVADIIAADASTTVTGYVTATGSKPFQNADGTTYTSYYITLLTPDGGKYDYQVSYDPSSYKGKAVTVSFLSGAAQIRSAASSGTSGTVSYASMTVGAQKMSPGIQILDVDSYGNAVATYPQRLDGMNLTTANVLYSQTDTTGAVTQLILNDVTGDTASYGILTKASEVNQSMTLRGTYAYNIAGTTGTYTTSDMIFNVQIGPAAFVMQGTAILRITSLTALGSVSSLSADAVVTNTGAKYRLSDKVGYYQLQSDGTYAVITAAKAAGMSLTAYYDKPENNGGRIRVIIAQ